MLEFTSTAFVGALAGWLGVLTDLDGSVIVVPFLVRLLGVNIRSAVTAALISVVVTSCTAVGKEVLPPVVRTAALLATAATIGSVGGALLSAALPVRAIEMLSGVVLIHSAYLTYRPHRSTTRSTSPMLLPTRKLAHAYQDITLSGAALLTLVAGSVCGLVGIGAGAARLLFLNSVLGPPSSTSRVSGELLIGAAAAAGACVLIYRGSLNLTLTIPVALGLSLGAFVTARALRLLARPLPRAFLSGIIAALALEMFCSGVPIQW